jgi:hypothetical protein
MTVYFKVTRHYKTKQIRVDLDTNEFVSKLVPVILNKLKESEFDYELTGSVIDLWVIGASDEPGQISKANLLAEPIIRIS